MDILLLILAIICGLLGLAGCILPVLPGPPLTYVGLLLLNWSGYAQFDTTSLVVWAVVTVVVTVIDFLLTPWMTKCFGGSKAGTWGAMLGLLVGFFIPLPFVGIILGPFLGALAGELLVARKQSGAAFKSALGAFLSFFVGTGIKLIACVAMIVACITAITW